MDNVFALFVCLINRIPVFIFGKSGYSKSLSFSILYNSMKGEYSKNDLFKKYPSLHVTSYQISSTSTSEEIQTAFHEAIKVAECSNKKNLSVILFDRLDFAEILPIDPINKILPFLDHNDIGVVGFSNWSLDSSKMNRAINVFVQEPNLEDLILTAYTIAGGIYEKIFQSLYLQNLIKNITKSYFEYKNYIKKVVYKINNHFYGERDFYYLIKIVAESLKNNMNHKSLEKIAMESIEMNFGGIELYKEENNPLPSIKTFKEMFSKEQNNYVEDINKYDLFFCIKNNLEKGNNRYLLLITNKTKNEALIEFILNQLQKKYRFIQGSKFENDQIEDYISEKTMQIISSMEKGELIILKDLENLYPKLYDLFDQNFVKISNAQYAKIILSLDKNKLHIVNENFRCIILLEQDEVNKQDPFFLSRLEKHLMSSSYLMTEKQNELAKEIYREIEDLTSIPENKQMIHLLININLEEIKCLLINITSKYKDDVDLNKNIIEIYKLLVPNFTQENILNALFLTNKKFIKNEDLINIYEQNFHSNIFNFLENIEKNKLMIYTFSPYDKDIFSIDTKIEIKNKKFGIISKNSIFEIRCEQNLSEKMINEFFELFHEKKNLNLFIFHIKLEDSRYLKYIKYQLDEFHRNNEENENKIFLFIIHIEINYKNEKIKNNEKSKNKLVNYIEDYYSYFLSYLSEYQQIQ